MSCETVSSELASSELTVSQLQIYFFSSMLIFSNDSDLLVFFLHLKVTTKLESDFPLIYTSLLRGVIYTHLDYLASVDTPGE